MAAAVRVEGDGRVLRVAWSDGLEARFHAEWLRDCSLDPTTRDARNGQRLITIGAVACDVRVVGARVERVGGAADGVAGGDAIVCDFSDGLRGAAFTLEWLRTRRYDRPCEARVAGWVRREARPWRAADLAGCVHEADLAALRRDDAVRADWLDAMVRDGVARVTGVPRESGAVCDVVGVFGFVRETNYGRWFDVKASVNPANLADTNLGLQAHTDNPYRDPVPTVQVLACLENDVAGGVSTVVDGWAVARDLAARDPKGFAVLASLPARWHWEGDGRTVLAAKRPVIELGPDGELLAVRWNSRSAAPMLDADFDEMPRWYAAYRAMSRMVDDPAYAVSFRLEPGEAFVVDNTRVLHARTAFSGGGTRWLQGCYADMDGVRSARAVLARRDASGGAQRR
jgi:gamma-butyrobetaine dioxygenase